LLNGLVNSGLKGSDSNTGSQHDDGDDPFATEHNGDDGKTSATTAAFAKMTAIAAKVKKQHETVKAQDIDMKYVIACQLVEAALQLRFAKLNMYELQTFAVPWTQIKDDKDAELKTYLEDFHRTPTKEKGKAMDAWTGLAFFGHMVPPNMYDEYGTLFEGQKSTRCYRREEQDWVFFMKIVNTMEQDITPNAMDHDEWFRNFVKILGKLFDVELSPQPDPESLKDIHIKGKIGSAANKHRCHEMLKDWKHWKIQKFLTKEQDLEED